MGGQQLGDCAVTGLGECAVMGLGDCAAAFVRVRTGMASPSLLCRLFILVRAGAYYQS